MKTFLYIKQHRTTGLKYFGKTSNRDPFKYNGSGKHWCNHLKKHGFDVITLRVWEFEDVEKCKQFALKFSIDNKIVSSKAWANMIDETGTGGWPSKWPIGSRDGDKNPFYGKTHSNEVRLKLSKIHKGKTITIEQRQKMSISLSKPKTETAKASYKRSMIERAKNPLDPSMIALRESRSKNWKLLTPDNKEIVIRSLRKFCEENSLNQKSLMNTIKLQCPIKSGSSKGWMIKERDCTIPTTLG